ncbi:MAG TPA: hypothetical protein PKA98_03675 [Acidimicrobiales bacterium]|nr:hypothetical protein [Acidimicrobiales bacterium]
MSTPLPAPGAARLGPPDRAEAQACLDATLAAVDPGDGPSELQQVLIEAAFASMTGHDVTRTPGAPVDPAGLAAVLADRDEAFRTRILQMMILGALVLRPLPAEVADRVDAYAEELSVDDGMLAVARRFASGQLGLAAVDFQRNGYTADWAPDRASALHASTELHDAWQQSVADAALAQRWAAFEQLPAGTLGRRMWELYRARGFAFPGSPGSAPPLLAQHDFVHVVADFGTRVESELEVFAFIARANDDPKGFSLLAMVVSLFETGYLASGAGLFESFPGQLSRTAWPSGSPTPFVVGRSATASTGGPTSTCSASTGSRSPTGPSRGCARPSGSCPRPPKPSPRAASAPGSQGASAPTSGPPPARRPRPKVGPTTPSAPRPDPPSATRGQGVACRFGGGHDGETRPRGPGSGRGAAGSPTEATMGDRARGGRGARRRRLLE